MERCTVAFCGWENPAIWQAVKVAGMKACARCRETQDRSMRPYWLAWRRILMVAPSAPLEVR